MLEGNVLSKFIRYFFATTKSVLRSKLQCISTVKLYELIICCLVLTDDGKHVLIHGFLKSYFCAENMGPEKGDAV